MDNKNNKEIVRRIIFALLAVGMMALIFWFSDQGASNSSEQSISVSYKVARVIRPGFEKLSPREKEAFVESIEAVIRKCAHFMEYTALGILLLGAYSCKKRKHKKSCILVICTAAAYSVTDEIHQHFVPGRSCEIRDMCIDTLGALTGVLIITLIQLLIGRIIWHHQVKQKKRRISGKVY